MSSKRQKNKHRSSTRSMKYRNVQPPRQAHESTGEINAVSPDDDTLVTPQAFVEALAPAQVDATATSTAAIGAQLQAAREAQGLSLEDAGLKLKLPARVLRKLESDDLSGIDYPIYLRGYLRSYSKLLGVTLPAMQSTIAQAAVATPELTPTGGVSHGRYLLQRYAAAATYVVVTALIVVPLLVLGLSGGIHREAARVVPLDSTASPTVATKTSATTPGKSNDTPLMASMAPFAALQKDLDHGDAAAAAGPAVAASTTNAAPALSAAVEHSVDLQLQAPSWVEITDTTGTRLEYGLLSAGNYRYHSNKVLDIRLGNSADAAVSVDGTTLDLQPYRRANVAHFRLDPKTGKPPKAKNG